MRHRSWASTALALCASLLAACQTAPGAGAGLPGPTLALIEVPGQGYVHTVLRAGSAVPQSPRLVFLEGDGRPWTDDGQRPAANPDPVRAIARELALLEQRGSMVLGRPCYHGRYDAPGCGPELWTSGRYSATVVASMALALEQLVGGSPTQPVVLVGYSGGGALALLVADRVTEVRAVVTLAANLDLEAWTASHGYLPLTDSLDPLAARALRPGCEIHLAAARDRVVPPSQLAAAVRRRPGALLWIERGADHACCWGRRWSTIAERIRTQLADAGCLDAT